MLPLDCCIAMLVARDRAKFGEISMRKTASAMPRRDIRQSLIISFAGEFALPMRDERDG